MMVERRMVLAAPRSCAKAPDTSGRVRQEISIQRLLEWAFADEYASVDFEDEGTLAQGYGHIGNAHRMLQRGELGCRIDGGGRSDPHPDADLVAAAVAVLPEGCGGRSMAVQIAELARQRRVPDLVEGVIMRLGDVDPCKLSGVVGLHAASVNRNPNYPMADTISLGYEFDTSGLRPKRWDVRVCPVRYSVLHPGIARARRNYLQWYSALMDLRQTFVSYNNLSCWSPTSKMPPMRPWQNSN
jgi:hypothetical protein